MGFSHFSPVHLAWLAAITAGTVLLSRWFRGKSARTQRRLSKALAWSMCDVLAAEHIILLATGHQTVYQLPLHLCTLMPVVCLLFSYTHWDWAGQTIYSLGIAGAALALLFPDWNRYPQWNYMNLTGFFVHGGLILYGVWQLVGKTVRPRLTAMWKPVLFLAVAAPPIYLIDRRLGTNYFFLLRGSPGSPLQTLQEQVGAAYLPAYAALIVALIAVEYLPWLGADRHR
ncbi:MAG: TIGR02206 family membrane protein [Clostridiales bacterium]|nr:TIGR02206 family membrane protein [Clostridiales bacterium]